MFWACAARQLLGNEPFIDFTGMSRSGIKEEYLYKERSWKYVKNQTV